MVIEVENNQFASGCSAISVMNIWMVIHSVENFAG